jgi:phosphomannomutase
MTTSHHSLYREYDIRGIVDSTLFAADAFKIGRSFAEIVCAKGGKRVVIARDGRISSPALASALAAGLASGGVTVEDAGLGPTPMLYFASHSVKADGAVMVTGSHNPPDHNGFKIVLGNKPFFGAAIQQLQQLVAGQDMPGPDDERAEPAMLPEVAGDYLARLLRDWRPGRDLTVVWDPGNGATGDIAALLAARLPGRHIVINQTIDGTFPAHHPDPTDAATLTQLQDRVALERADLGIAFDGDGDRIGVVDGLGRILWGDHLLLLLAEEVLQARPGATIIADVKASQSLFDQIAALGGQPLMWRTGHSLIKAKMAETGAPLAGEMSGHIFIGDHYYGFDDALYAAIRLLSIIAGWPTETLAQRFDRMPKLLNTPELRFDCPDDSKFAVVEEVRQRLRRSGAQFDDLDGVRVKGGDGWWLLRASNTQAVLVARCEGQDAAALARMKGELAGHLQAVGVALPRGILD